MYSDKRGIHTETCTASIMTRRGAFKSPFTELSNAPSAVVHGPLMREIHGDLVRIEGRILCILEMRVLTFLTFLSSFLSDPIVPNIE